MSQCFSCNLYVWLYDKELHEISHLVIFSSLVLLIVLVLSNVIGYDVYSARNAILLTLLG